MSNNESARKALAGWMDGWKESCFLGSCDRVDDIIRRSEVTFLAHLCSALCSYLTTRAISLMPHTLDYNLNVYLAVSLTDASKYKYEPINIAPATDIGNVGSLEDVKLLSVPKDAWLDAQEQILHILNGDRENVQRVDVQQPKLRTKRGGDEL